MVNLKKKGFTIIELVIVIAVIAVLAAVLIPTFSNLVKKANMSADMQIVKNMNTVLAADEVIDGKPATVVEAKEVLTNNGISTFTAHNADNQYYWIGSENRVLLWEGDSEAGKVIYPEEYKKMYSDLSKPSVDWSSLTEPLEILEVIATESKTLEEAFLETLGNASAEKSNYIILPENSTMTLDYSQIGAFNGAMSDSGVGKNIHIDLNGSTLNAERGTTIFNVPNGGSLEFVNGNMNIVSTNYAHAGFQVQTGASLTLRNVDVKGLAYALLFPSSTASEIIIDNSKIECDAVYGLSTNGMTSDDIRIVITNSEIKNTVNGGGIGVLVNCGSNVYIENSHIVGAQHSLIMRAGKVNVIDSTLETIATAAGIYKYDTFNHFQKRPQINGEYILSENEYIWAWSEGNAIPGAVLVLGDYSDKDTNYPDPVICELNNVTLKSANTSEVPYVLVAARANKDVTFNYCDCNIDHIEMYNYMRPEYFGSITINGEQKIVN